MKRGIYLVKHSPKNGKIYFPVGVNTNERNHHTKLTSSAVARNIQHVMDVYLNDEVKCKLEKEQAKPLSLQATRRKTDSRQAASPARRGRARSPDRETRTLPAQERRYRGPQELGARCRTGTGTVGRLVVRPNHHRNHGEPLQPDLYREERQTDSFTHHLCQ